MQFLDLPNELITRIISFHDTPSPFDLNILEKPKSSLKPRESDNGIRLLSISPSSAIQHYPLKSLTLTNQLLRSLTLRTLFHHATLDPLHLTDFLKFLHANSLTTAVTSLIAHVSGHCNHIHPAWWARLLNEVPATRLSIIAAPEVFGELAGVHSWTTDAWAFDMPFQILRLEQGAESAHRKIDYDNLPNLLTARRWHSMAYNEGSSISAYTGYEFFLRKTPSLLTALHLNNAAAGDDLFTNLLSFDFIAIFPFYNHVDEVLKCVRKMLRLRRLFIRLCPSIDSPEFQDEVESAGGALDVHDLWNETDTSWTLVAHTVKFLSVEGELHELHMADVKLDGIDVMMGASLDNAQLGDAWQHQVENPGVWRRMF